MMHKYTNDRLCVFYTCVSINSVIKWTSKGVVTMASTYGNPRGKAATDAKRKRKRKKKLPVKAQKRKPPRNPAIRTMKAKD